MVGGRWAPGSAVLMALSCASCGASNHETCSFPATAPLGAFEVRERNELSAFNRVVSAAYALDDCELESSAKPSVPGREAVIVLPKWTSAGRHRFRIAVKVRSAVGPDFPAHDHVLTKTVPVDIPQDGTTSITVRIFDDPSKHVTFVMVLFSFIEHPSAEANGVGAR